MRLYEIIESIFVICVVIMLVSMGLLLLVLLEINQFLYDMEVELNYRIAFLSVFALMFYFAVRYVVLKYVDYASR